MTMTKKFKVRVVMAVMLAMFAVTAGSQVLPEVFEMGVAFAEDCEGDTCG